jgi:hypothetical protein
MVSAVCEPSFVMADKRTYTSAKIGVDVYRDIRSLAAFYGMDANDYLTDLLEPIVAQRMAKMADEITARARTVRSTKNKP